jgi:hypothetical protein
MWRYVQSSSNLSFVKAVQHVRKEVFGFLYAEVPSTETPYLRRDAYYIAAQNFGYATT